MYLWSYLTELENKAKIQTLGTANCLNATLSTNKQPDQHKGDSPK